MKLFFDQKHDVSHTCDCMLSNFLGLERGLHERSKHFTVPSPIQDSFVDQSDDCDVIRLCVNITTVRDMKFFRHIVYLHELPKTELRSIEMRVF